jgi:uncharacterized integral membrane protein (TIGR00698 family)
MYPSEAGLWGKHIPPPGIRVTVQQPASNLSEPVTGNLLRILPGVVLSCLLASAAAGIAYAMIKVFPIPAMVVALILGIALNPLARQPVFHAGTQFCLKVILPIGVALLGLRIAFADIAALGIATAALVMLGMVCTIGSGFVFARLLGQSSAFGALAGVATAVCGASATLATAIVLPDYRNKAAEVAFACVAVNALSTVAMVLYPLLCAWIGFDDRISGVMLGATIHDVAQVVGAGYAVSEPAGNTAVIVKLFRVFLLLPVVLSIGWWFTSTGVRNVAGEIRIPKFAIGFLVLCIVNSLVPSVGGIVPAYDTVKAAGNEVSSWGLLIAISALGLRTSFAGVAALGWRHIATVTGTTIVILGTATAGLMLLA